MQAVFLPGGRQVDVRHVAVPEPGPGQVLVRMRASAICGSDLRAIYREHLGRGPEAYCGVIAGHEPCGEIVATGPGCRRFGIGQRVVLYHIAGCGLCSECRRGYMIGCTSALRAAYGWQRDGGHAEFLVADETTCILLPDTLSYVDGACVACGFGTVYEALARVGVSGRDAVLIVGMGPMGLAAGLLAKALGATLTVGVDVTEPRLALGTALGALDHAVVAGQHAVEAARQLTGGHGFEVAIDCSGSGAGRLVALQGTRRWGRCVLVGEGARLDIDVSQELIHNQITLFGSWVTSVGRMEELVELLERWDLHPERTVTHRFALVDAAAAYRVADEGVAGKVALVMDA